jgi:hypothetical protein
MRGNDSNSAPEETYLQYHYSLDSSDNYIWGLSAPLLCSSSVQYSVTYRGSQMESLDEINGTRATSSSSIAPAEEASISLPLRDDTIEDQNASIESVPSRDSTSQANVGPSTTHHDRDDPGVSNRDREGAIDGQGATDTETELHDERDSPKFLADDQELEGLWLLDGREEKRRNKKNGRTIPPKKRLFVCCDGTWNNAVGSANHITNVARLARSVPTWTDDDMLQLVYYSSGVGTRGEKAGNMVQGLTGKGKHTFYTASNTSS